ncbi:lysozyme inhibitor LprI family protein [Candidatus Contendibacter odensensis]|uniref:lysozyme inhibitor LprI family protein n=1 Tax=Candidatus Contendibacter odensensis TaxID=1400860 RepID=UPI0018AAAB53|nr:lysozyme inhibitor LprI family protein [Candidatus Contendobacter odensis]MBK8750963.1 DUF1311 domain-containing protein [Candidatus Competibacteraceae bacterium]
MPIKFMAALFTGLFVISNSLIAEECSSQTENSVSIMDCLSARYKTADQELNAIYNRHYQKHKEPTQQPPAESRWVEVTD